MHLSTDCQRLINVPPWYSPPRGHKMASVSSRLCPPILISLLFCHQFENHTQFWKYNIKCATHALAADGYDADCYATTEVGVNQCPLNELESWMCWGEKHGELTQLAEAGILAESFLFQRLSPWRAGILDVKGCKYGFLNIHLYDGNVIVPCKHLAIFRMHEQFLGQNDIFPGSFWLLYHFFAGWTYIELPKDHEDIVSCGHHLRIWAWLWC